MNPFRRRHGRAPVLAMVTWVYILWSLLPVLVAVRISFNSGKSRSSFQSLSARWYWGDPTSSVWHDDSLQTALVNTLQLAALCMLIATPLGVLMAIGLNRWRSRASTAANGLMLVPIVTPEIVFGVALFLVFTQAYTGVPSGMTRQLIGHVTFTMSFVVVIVRGRLVAIGGQYEEAARDLGATGWQTFRKVTFPLIAPAVLAGLIIWLFLRDWGTAVMTGLVVPVTMVITFIVMKLFGQGFNLMTLGGLAAALLVPLVPVDFQTGLGMTLRGFIAAALAGMVPGAAVFCGFLLGLFEAFVTSYGGALASDPVVFLVLIVADVGGKEPDRVLGRPRRRHRVVHRDLPVVRARRVVLRMEHHLRALGDAGASRRGEAEGFVADDDADLDPEQLVDVEAGTGRVGDGVERRQFGLVVDAEDLSFGRDRQRRIVGLALQRVRLERRLGTEDAGHLELAAALRAAAHPIGLVPTMGALHAGHAALITAARAASATVVVSIYVNPRQFTSGTDFAGYPRDLAADAALAHAAGADLIFAPDDATIYPPDDAVPTIDPGPLAVRLEGAARPGHFAGVATVVTILFDLVAPDAAWFGEKDAQQLRVVEALAARRGGPAIHRVPTGNSTFRRLYPTSSCEPH